MYLGVSGLNLPYLLFLRFESDADVAVEASIFLLRAFVFLGGFFPDAFEQLM
jgi:hypothetical protein